MREDAMRTVGDAMAAPVVVEASETIQDAAAAMLDGRSEVAILVEDGKLCGLIAAEDVARALAEGRDPAQTPVGAIGEADPPLARRDEALADVHQRMRAGQRARAVVVGRHGEPVGLLVDPEAAP
jgi:predicted transcriptional regulator